VAQQRIIGGLGATGLSRSAAGRFVTSEITHHGRIEPPGLNDVRRKFFQMADASVPDRAGRGLITKNYRYDQNQTKHWRI